MLPVFPPSRYTFIMKGILLSFLLASILLTLSTLAGMTVFGMRGVMSHMDSDSCVSTDCPISNNTGETETGCLNHCLSVASSASTAVVPMPFTFVFLITAVALLLAEWIPTIRTIAFSNERWREGIGKLLLQQKLSTVILRD